MIFIKQDGLDFAERDRVDGTMTYWVSLILVCSVFTVSIESAVAAVLSCRTILSQYGQGIDIRALLQGNRPVIIAHGKNYNRAVEGSWRNLKNSIEKSGAIPLVLEMDLQLTKDDQFLVVHDPTLHRLVRGYQTNPIDKIEFMVEAAREPALLMRAIEAERQGEFAFNLFDGINRHSLAEIKNKFYLYDPKSFQETEFIALDEILAAFRKVDSVSLPSYRVIRNEKISTVESSVLHLSKPVFLYLDVKGINHWSRRLEGLSDWDWIKGSWSDERLERYTVKLIQILNRKLSINQMFGRVVVAVRHPKVYELFKVNAPNIEVMWSSDRITQQTSNDEFIRIMEEFLRLRESPIQWQLVEVKYLKHILSPEIRSWAEQNSVRLFYDQIKETDLTQFLPPYAGNIALLWDEIFRLGANFWVQTNTVESLTVYLEQNHHY